jgi:putative transposase
MTRKQLMISMSDLPYHLGLKMRIYPSSQQKKIIAINCGVSRSVYNKLIAINSELMQLRKTGIYIKTIAERIETLELRKKNLSKYYSYMSVKEVDSLTIAQAKLNYNAAWSMFKKIHSSGVPKYHKKGVSDSYQTSCIYTTDNKKKGNCTPFTGSVRFLDTKHVQLPKLGRIRISGSSYQKILAHNPNFRIGTATIKCDASGYYLSLQIGDVVPFVNLKPKAGKVTGIDLNTDNFLTDSYGNVVDNPRYYRKSLKRLKKLQRQMARRQVRAKKEGRKLAESRNYQKSRLQAARLHQHVKNQRENFLQKLSTAYINNHDVVVLEDLRGKNLMKNHALAMSIADVGWSNFQKMLEYKAGLYGKKYIEIDKRNTTQRCSNCGSIMGHNGYPKLTLKDREWNCPICKVHHIRDYNAALNILEKGIAKLEEEEKTIIPYKN